MAYDDLIIKAANTYGLDANLLRAQMRQESGGKQNAMSNKGASGLMQLMPATARELGVTDIFDPEQNVMAGAKYMRQQLDKYKRPELALAAYNAGPGAVDKYGGIPPYRETQNYVKRIMSNYAKLAGDIGNAIIKPAMADDAPSEELMQKYQAWKQSKQQAQNQDQDYGYGNRPDGSLKGKGWLGELKMLDGSDGVATEKTIGVNIDGKETDIPAIVPTLNDEQKEYILRGGDVLKRKDIIDNAVKHAIGRIRNGLSPYADNNNQPVNDAPSPELMAKYQAWKASKQKPYNPVDEMSTTDKVLAGVGGAMMDTVQGAGQMVGLVSPEDVAEKRRLDKALLDTTAGKVGNVAGNIATFLPTVAIPGANTLKGASLIGAGIGALQPAVSEKEVLGNAALGAGANAAGIAIPRIAEAAYKGGKALFVEPFTKKGMEQIAGRTLARFSENPDALANVIKQASLTGAKPTLAEITKDKGIASLQDALRSADPQIENVIAQRLQENNAARVGALQRLAGDATKREAAIYVRDTIAEPFYKKAKAKTIEISPKLKELLNRPSVKKAFPRAAQLAKEEGREFGFNKPKEASKFLLDAKGNKLKGIDDEAGEITGQTLHDIKMGMDALLKDPNSGIAGAEINAVKNTRAELLQEIEKAIPEYKNARLSYSAGSAPINAMDIGEFLSKKALSNTSDLSGNQRLQANALLGILKDPKKLIEQGTGRKGMGSDLSKIFTKDQIALLKTVAKEVDTAAAVASAGNGPGSATAKRMASQNILRQMLGPLGLPESWIDSVLAQTVAKPLNVIYGGIVEPKLQQQLANAVLDPANAKRVLAAARNSAKKGIKPTNNALRRALATMPAALANSGE